MSANEGLRVHLVVVTGATRGLGRSIAAYCAAKGELEALTRSLAVESATRGVRVNCVAPGYLATDLTAGLRRNDTLSSMVLAHTPMKRFGESAELVGTGMFPAPPAASYVAGQALSVDGGWNAS